jgi:histidyl-tRNA synthetase
MAEVIAGAPKLIDTLGGPSREHFDALQELLREAGVPYTVNPRLVRGLDYYNRTVFEWVTDRLGAQGTICAGGRYDGLIGQLGGKPAPATGFGLGVERVVLLLEQAEAAGVPAGSGTDVYVVHQGEHAGAFARRTADALRDAGLDVAVHCGGGSFKAQMKRADASGARYAVIVGDDEAAAGAVSVKALRDERPQVRVTVAEAIALVGKD